MSEKNCSGPIDPCCTVITNAALFCGSLRNPPHTLKVIVAIQFAALALGVPDRFTETFKDGVLCIVHFQALAQGVIGGADTGGLVDADLVGNGEME